MSTQITKEQFELIYNETYNEILKYIICKCSNLDDVNDMIQDTYVELYKNLNKKNKLEVEKLNSYIIGICKNILKKYYKTKNEKSSMILKNEINDEKNIKSDFDLEIKIITKENVEEVWRLYRNQRSTHTKNIFSLLFV